MSSASTGSARAPKSPRPLPDLPPYSRSIGRRGKNGYRPDPAGDEAAADAFAEAGAPWPRGAASEELLDLDLAHLMRPSARRFRRFADQGLAHPRCLLTPDGAAPHTVRRAADARAGRRPPPRATHRR